MFMNNGDYDDIFPSLFFYFSIHYIYINVMVYLLPWGKNLA